MGSYRGGAAHVVQVIHLLKVFLNGEDSACLRTVLLKAWEMPMAPCWPGTQNTIKSERSRLPKPPLPGARHLSPYRPRIL